MPQEQTPPLQHQTVNVEVPLLQQTSSRPGLGSLLAEHPFPSLLSLYTQQTECTMRERERERDDAQTLRNDTVICSFLLHQLCIGAQLIC